MSSKPVVPYHCKIVILRAAADRILHVSAVPDSLDDCLPEFCLPGESGYPQSEFDFRSPVVVDERDRSTIRE